MYDMLFVIFFSISFTLSIFSCLKGRGANEEPINAYCLTFVIAVGFMMIGSLNAIAPFITNFFMISYALINFAAFVADMSGSPGWRPTWTFYNPWVCGNLLTTMYHVHYWYLLTFFSSFIIAYFRYVNIFTFSVNSVSVLVSIQSANNDV